MNIILLLLLLTMSPFCLAGTTPINASSSISMNILPESKVATAISFSLSDHRTFEKNNHSVFFSRKMIFSTFAKNRQVLLTFDDGPHPEVTPKILDILKKYQLKAIFFVIGVNARKYPSIVKRIYDEGHTIGNHTFYHLNLTKLSRERVLEEIRSTNQLIEKITGVRPKVFRPPYGALNSTIIELLQQEGMDIMLWNVDPADWRNRSMNRTMEILKRQMHLNYGGRGGIVLFHDTMQSTANALEPFIMSLYQNGLVATNYYGNKILVSADKKFWDTTSPKLLKWERPFTFDPEVLGNSFISAIFNSTKKVPLSPLGLLKAKKNGSFFKILLCRNF